ncbi:MAG TPA: hypothetical protein VKF63_02785 [Terracidiphilus sp.]|nr:hypothetical protein [Terracidiphilus sp.]
MEVYSEQCRWRYASAACGDATNNPCQNSFETCRQPSRFAGVLNTFTIAPTPSLAQVSTRMTVRRRQT